MSEYISLIMDGMAGYSGIINDSMAEYTKIILGSISFDRWMTFILFVITWIILGVLYAKKRS